MWLFEGTLVSSINKTIYKCTSKWNIYAHRVINYLAYFSSQTKYGIGSWNWLDQLILRINVFPMHAIFYFE